MRIGFASSISNLLGIDCVVLGVCAHGSDVNEPVPIVISDYQAILVALDPEEHAIRCDETGTSVSCPDLGWHVPKFLLSLAMPEVSERAPCYHPQFSIYAALKLEARGKCPNREIRSRAGRSVLWAVQHLPEHSHRGIASQRQVFTREATADCGLSSARRVWRSATLRSNFCFRQP